MMQKILLGKIYIFSLTYERTLININIYDVYERTFMHRWNIGRGRFGGFCDKQESR